MRFLYNNKVKTATLSATNGDGSYPIENVTHKFLQKKFQTTTGTVSSEITIELMEAITSDYIAIGYHNATSGTYALYDSSDSLISTNSLALTYSTDITYYTDEVDVKKIVLNITKTGADPLYIGGISTSKSLLFLYQNVNPDLNLPDRDTTRVTDGGQLIGKQRTPLAVYKSGLRQITEDQKAELEVMKRLIGKVVPIYFDLYSGKHSIAAPLYCTVTSSLDCKKNSYDGTYATPVQVMEAK